MTTPLDRRTFLRASGVSLALPLLETMNPALASEDVGPPKRSVFICVALGLHAPSLFPTTTGADYEQTEYLDVLQDHRSEFTLFSGLSHPEQNGQDGHSSQMTWLTAAPHPATDGFRNTISVDQLAAEKLGYVTRFPSMILNTLGSSSQSYTRGGVMIPAESRPSKLFAKMFLKGKPDEVRRQKQNLIDGRSIFDSLMDQTHGLLRGASSADRHKLEQYFQSIRKAEQDLARAQQWMKTPKPTPDEQPPTDIHDSSDLIGRTQLLMNMMPLILQSDSSRVISLVIDNVNFVPQIRGVSIDHHTLSHHGKEETKIEQLKIVEKAILNCFSDLLDQLKSQEEAGSRLLDNTTVLLGSNLGNANSHDWRNQPTFLAGGGFKHGSYVAHDKDNNTPLCHLFLSMLHNMGVEVDSFASSSGALSW